MAVQLPDVVRTPVPGPQRRRQPPADDVPRTARPPEPLSVAAPAAPLTTRADPTAAPPDPGSSAWGGAAVVVVPTGGLLAMVAAVVVVNEVNQWWTLGFAMALAIFATLLVVATIMRMLGGEDD